VSSLADASKEIIITDILYLLYDEISREKILQRFYRYGGHHTFDKVAKII
jgi:hypothetical protein